MAAVEGFKVTPPSTEGLPEIDYESNTYWTMRSIHELAMKNDPNIINVLNIWRAELEGIGTDDEYTDEMKKIDGDIEEKFKFLKEEYESRNRGIELSFSTCQSIKMELERSHIYNRYKVIVGFINRKGSIPHSVSYVRWDINKEFEQQMLNAISLREDRERIRGVIRGYPNPFRLKNKATNLGRK